MDLTKYQLDLLGQRFIKRRSKDDRVVDKDREFVIDEVFPHQVRAYSVCENGYRIVESFSVGDLILAGLLRSRVDHEYGKNYLNGYGL